MLTLGECIASSGRTNDDIKQYIILKINTIKKVTLPLDLVFYFFQNI